MATDPRMQNISMFKTQSPYEQQIEEMKRRQQMAEMLQQQALQPLESQVAPGGMVVPTSPVLGLTKMLQAYMGGKQLRDIEKQKGEIEKGDIASAMEFMKNIPSAKSVYGEGPASGLSEQQASAINLNPNIQAKPSGLSPDMESAINLQPQQEQKASMMSVAPSTEERASYMMQGAIGSSPRTRMLASALMKPTEYEGGVKFTAEGKPYMVSKSGDVKFLKDSGITPRDEYSAVTANKIADLGFDMMKFNNLSADQQANIRIAISNNDLARAKNLFETGVSVPGPTIARALQSSAPPSPVAGAGAQPRPVAQMPPTAKPTATAQPSEPKVIPQIKNPSLSGAQRQKLIGEMPQAQQAAYGTLNKLQSIENLLADLETHPGLEKITGKLGQYEATDMTDKALNARTLYNTLKNQISIEAITQARNESKTGGAYGSMTEKEWPRLESSLGAISNAQSADDLKIAIRNAKKVVQSFKTNATTNWGQIYGEDTLKWKPIEYQPNRYSKKDDAQELLDAADRIIGTTM
jgi:hypothetical protein